MGPALFAITLESMKSEVDEVALQGTLMNFYLYIKIQRTMHKKCKSR